MRTKKLKSLLLCFLLLCFLPLCFLPLCFLPLNAISSENGQIKELDSEHFLQEVFEKINEERSFKGLLPLQEDNIASKTAGDQANDLILKEYLSYFNLKHQCPDERYTASGGTGAVVEVIKGFELDKNEKKIKLTELLAKQLIEAITLDSDDSQVLFSPYLTHVGCGFSRSQDGKKFVSVIDFVTKGGEFEPIKPVLNLGEKLSLKGKVNSPFKFKAVSIAYFNESEFQNSEDQTPELSFDNDNLAPYFPPQDYIAYSNTGKNNFIKVLKGLGAIGAIGASPFTGGASAILAPMLISSIQNGPPKEIPLKGGIKANSKGEFSGEIDLNYQSMSGLYFVSVLGELPSINYPIVISRRTVRVNAPLQPISHLTK